MALDELLLEQSQLGKKTEYDHHYSPDKLFAIPRKSKRDEIGVPSLLPFKGFDLWNHYEVSWLNEKGKPMVAMAEIRYDCESPNIIESKSMKLYFNALNNTKFYNIHIVRNTIQQDLAQLVGSPVQVTLIPLSEKNELSSPVHFSGICLDEQDIECTSYLVQPAYLKTEQKEVEETLYSNLLKSNCPVTNQPDWGSIQISYKGKKINREGLLRYIVSFRDHNDFHEQCIERIFMDIMRQCQPRELIVYGRYTRRGGLDINPYRCTPHCEILDENIRLFRQ